MNTTTACRDLYHYGLSSEEHDQVLFSTNSPNTRGMFLTRSLRSVLENPTMFIYNLMRMSMYVQGNDQIMKIIEHCRIKNNWGILSFFNNTMRGIVFMDYQLENRRMVMEQTLTYIRGFTHMCILIGLNRRFIKDMLVKKLVNYLSNS